MPIANIIFDLDGTLGDTGQDITNAVNFVSAPLGIADMEVHEVTNMVGHGIGNLIAQALAPLGEEADTHKQKAIEAFVSYYNAHLTVHTLPYPGVPETLAELRGMGLTLAVLSNKRTSMCEGILRDLGLLVHFRLVAGGGYSHEKKPHPSSIQAVLDALGAGAATALMVGDSSVDIETARSVGMRSVGVTYGFRPRAALTTA